MSLLRILFRKPRYRRFAVLGRSSDGLFWDYRIWVDRIFPKLNRLVETVGSRPSVHCRQLAGADKGVKFGRISWSAADAEKWAHHSDVRREQCREWLFEDLEVYAPSWAQLGKNLEMPKLYIQVAPMPWLGDPAKASYDQVIQIIVREDEYAKAVEEIDRTVRVLASDANAVAVYCHRGRVNALNAFESLLREDFLYRGMREDELPREKKMKGDWSIWT